MVMRKELDILKAFLPVLPESPDVPVGPGDDCAAIDLGAGELLLAAVDQLIGDVHYYRDSTAPELAGAKLVKRNLSDIAAMGGKPCWALLTLADGGRSTEWLLRFCRGVADTAEEYGVNLCGGDIASLPRSCEGEVTTLTILGRVERADIVRRSTASPGDWLFVTGELGNTLASGRHLDFLPRLAEGQILAQRHWAGAMMDISDGLLLDSVRMADASCVTLEIEPEKVPLYRGATAEAALSDGEDYELLFTVPPEKVEDFLKNYPAELTPCSRIGRVIERRSCAVCDSSGDDLLKNRRGGYEH